MFEAVDGDSVAAALVASGKLTLKRDKRGAPRGLFCGMGTCFDCQVSVDGGPAQRACLTKVRPGMKIRSLAYRAEIPVSDAASQQDQPERSCGIDVEILSKTDLGNIAPMVAGGMAGAAYCPGEGKINPLLATPLLLSEALNSGARISETPPSAIFATKREDTLSRQAMGEYPATMLSMRPADGQQISLR